MRRAGTRRIDNSGAETGKLVGLKRLTEEVAGFRSELLQTLGMAPSSIERARHRPVALDRVDRSLARNRQSERTAASEQVDNGGGALDDVENIGP